MAEGVSLNNASFNVRPSLKWGVRLRLSVMMFMQFAVWGAYFVVWNVYLGTPLAKGGLGFSGTQIGSLYGTMAMGAIISMMFAGQLADRVMSSEYLMAIFHLAGAGLLYAMATVHDYGTLWWVSLAFALVYNPTLAVANSISFANIPDATRDFPTLRVLGTIGWIAASTAVDVVLGREPPQPISRLSWRPSCLRRWGYSASPFRIPLHPGKKSEALPFLRALSFCSIQASGFSSASASSSPSHWRSITTLHPYTSVRSV